MSNTIVRTNVMSLNSHRNLGLVGNQQSRASQRLSSGFRINSAADDAAGLGISEKMRAQIRGLDQASRNGQDGISLIQTAEGAMATINEMVTRIRELVVQAANDTNAHDDETNATWSQSDRTRIQAEINQLMSEIDATADRVEFNTRTLLNGDLGSGSVAGAGGGAIALALSGFGFGDEDAARLATALAAAAGFTVGENVIAGDALNAFLAEFNPGIEIEDWGELMDAAGNELVGIADDDDQAAFFAWFEASGLLEMFQNGRETAFTDAEVATLLSGAESEHSFMLGVGEEDDGVTVNQIRSWLNASRENLNSALRNGSLWDLDVDHLANVERDEDENFTLDEENLEALGDFLTNFWNNTFGESLDDAAFGGGAGAGGGGALWFQVGANREQGVWLSIESVRVADLSAVGEGDPDVQTGFTFADLRNSTPDNEAGDITIGAAGQGVMRESGEEIQRFLTAIDFALSHVTQERSNLGAMQNRLEFTIENLDIASENLSAAESRIRDADMAREMMRLTQANVLQQAAISMLAQANQAPQSVLQLLG